MSGPATGITVAAFLLSSALAGVMLHQRMPSGVITSRTVDVIRRSVGIIALMAGVMLVLLTLSLKSQFDSADRNVRRFSAEVVELDRVLRRVGPAAEPARTLLFRYSARTLKDFWPSTTPLIGPGDIQGKKLLNQLEDSVALLSPVTPLQRESAAAAREALHGLVHARWTLDERTGVQLSPWIVTVLVFWLMLTFASLGIAAPRSPIILGAIALCAVALGSGVFLAVEYADPYEGIIVVSSEPVQNALFALTE